MQTVPPAAFVHFIPQGQLIVGARQVSKKPGRPNAAWAIGCKNQSPLSFGPGPVHAPFGGEAAVGVRRNRVVRMFILKLHRWPKTIVSA